MDDPRVIAAVIAGAVAFIGSALGFVITLLNNRRQLRVQIEQLELKKQEIEQIQQKAADDLEALRQSQYEQILSKRTEVYPRLWAIHIRYETNWVIEGKSKTRKWACEYLSALNEFNLEGGLFFSQAVYEKFGELRWALVKACKQTSDDDLVNEELQTKIFAAVYGKEAEEGKDAEPGLSTHEKDDLGSYRPVFIQRRFDDA